MKYFYLLTLVTLFSCTKSTESPIPQPASRIEAAVTLTETLLPTKPRHIFIVWFENKAYSQIVGATDAPYINSLISRGTLFTKSYALSHPSYPNYIAFFAGTRAGVTSDACIDGRPKLNKTIYNSLNDVHTSFRWYNEDIPNAGSDTCRAGYYVEKHNPTTIFSKVPAKISVPFSWYHYDDTASFKNLPKVACFTPNLMNDMHDGSIARGDAWLKSRFAKLVDWSLKNNSILLVYFDEDNEKTDNRIPVVAVGQHIKAAHKDNELHNHYSFTKSILHWYGADSTFTNNLIAAKTIRHIWR